MCELPAVKCGGSLRELRPSITQLDGQTLSFPYYIASIQKLIKLLRICMVTTIKLIFTIDPYGSHAFSFREQ